MSSEVVNDVMCPLVNRMIELGLCMDIQEILEPDISFKLSDEHKRICKACKKRIDPSL